MGYYEILEHLKKQIKDIKTNDEYIKQERNLAIQTKQIAKELELNIKSVRNAIKKLKKNEEIKVLEGILNKSERYYILSKKAMEKKWKSK